ncbi:N-acetylmuramoyl-L-alanine amidase [Suilimivivens sp.]
MFLTAGRAGSYVSSIRVQTYGDSVQKGSQNSGSSWGEEQDEKGVWKKNRKMAKYCVVVDAGHGGSDPGKVGINQALEKDVNLQIAEKLKAFLEAEDIRVVMTRETDGGLYDENVSNKKVQDMKRRIAIIEEADPVLVVSIHQNSYQQESVKGAQVFYYATSERSRMLASMIQKEFQVLQPDNRRLEKGNDSYYLLKKTAKPIVIAECGFLSNAEEAEKLVTQEYQERVAWRIHMGIMKYIGTGQTA